MGKYSVNSNEGEILPNLLNLKDKTAIDKAEFEGLLYSEILLTESLTADTIFSVDYIKNIHFQAFKELYSFAGKYRTVNVSKDGFMFPAAEFLPQSMETFENEILSNLPDIYHNNDLLIKDLATVHAELLFIHPFREGNGRTARILANLMGRKQGIESLNFDKIDNKIYPKYVSAVQSAGKKNFKPMIQIMKLIF
jgi:cell filamentation protein